MTESFEHPDGHSYRFLGFDNIAKQKYWGHYVQPDGCADATPCRMVEITSSAMATKPVSIFKRVEPPLWPWTGPSGTTYEWHNGYVTWSDKIPSIPIADAAGLGKHLLKQAELNQ